MKKVKVNLQPIISHINLPTVLKTAVLPGDSTESLFIATQVGEVLYVKNGIAKNFLDIRHRVIQLGSNGGYDERGLVGLAFHPDFYHNGLFYLHYSVAGSQGPGALSDSFEPDPCDPKTLTMKWKNREQNYDHIDTVEEWRYKSNNKPQKRRTLLNLRRPFFNHNGVNSLNFSPETGNLVLTTGDGGSGFDPFNLSQDPMEIAGKIIEVDVKGDTSSVEPPAVSRFNELPESLQEILTVIVIGVRNAPGISFHRLNNQYMKYVGHVGQELIESIFSFSNIKPLGVKDLVQSHVKKTGPDLDGIVNLGWRGWEGDFPSPIIKDCSNNNDLDKKIIAFYNDAVITSTKRLRPLINYFHQDPRANKFRGTALTGVQAYTGKRISDLNDSIVFTDFARREESDDPTRGVLAYTRVRMDGQPNDFSVIDNDFNFGNEDAYYVSLGTDLKQKRLFLGTYGSSKVTEFKQGTVFEIVP
ncbi:MULTISPECIES: PQQ-dependent sugar dehydrogenase [Bacillaceae]|uniref:PQQ-dependent sugar dehydrogenase n=1 Tax=Evansella alkalicola TaxID=745819 RepID=A0ABS6JVN5_9BACI|nr:MULTISPECIES: PQQ-dependent sugar dehydrogenase [Bacillaceae]MBU9722645.1 PQQ-dependent sugar dehydrogenase [Bacillus alkalicola]